MDYAPWPSFEEDEIQAAVDVLRSGKVNQWTGEQVTRFESEFAEYIGTGYAVALANGSLALDLAMTVFEIGPGDEVIVTPRSFVASVSCVALRGAVPVFVDVDPVTQNITLEAVKLAVTGRTRAVIAVNHAGWPCELGPMRKFCDEKGLILIEDCAQSHGAVYGGKKAGSYGHCSVFSFCQDKIMTTGGEGGMFLTRDKSTWQAAWSFKDHGKGYDTVYHKKHPQGFRWLVESLGTNLRMTEMQAAMGRVMLRKLDRWVEKRRALAGMFNQAFKTVPGLRITEPDSHIRHAYYKYYAFCDPDRLPEGVTRDHILDALADAGTPCLSGSCPEIYLEKSFASAPFRIAGDAPYLPVARQLGETSLMFMVHPTLDSATITGWISNVKQVMARCLD